ncbi:MAG: ABC transporter permease [Actinobacteria bacterium]|nr:ABC transporter permease [Actinomycetota bacterium]MBU1944732.1 ABC transporter permease [Actinomycetota bacterium]MBU2688413.1 ABC transporter permease [Actinomycetota bacterium]
MVTVSQFWHALWLSLVVSGLATVIGAAIGVPLGTLMAEYSFPGKRALLTVVHAFMGLPPVVVGLFTFLIIARSGPLGDLGLIYTAAAMVIVQVILAAPIVTGLTHATLKDIDPRLGLQARSLGASALQSTMVKIREARAGIVAAVIAGFGRVIAEVGAVTIVGGAINGKTDTLTTLTVKLTRQGYTSLALVVGVVLIALALVVNVFLTRLQTDREQREEHKRVTGYVA